MDRLVTVAEMRKVEEEADASGLSYAQMMQNAGKGLADQIALEYGCQKKGGVLALVGSGNNGGDALVALTLLARSGWEAWAYLVRSRPVDDPLVDGFLRSGGRVLRQEEDQKYANLGDALRKASILVDGVLGTGIRLPLQGASAEVLGLVKDYILQNRGRIQVVAVDCPSGVDCDSGAAAQETIPADLTVTMAAVKTGLFKFPAAALTGRLKVVGIGDLNHLASWQSVRRFVVAAEDIRRFLPSRPLDAHKGSFGTALIVAGCAQYTGAALLAGEAAYRAGVGLVTMAVAESLHRALAGHFPEATWVLLSEQNGAIAANAVAAVAANLRRATGLLLGPGFGLEDTTMAFLHALLRESAGSLPPLVIDADGLKHLAKLPNWPSLIPSPAILTPHPGEMAVLTGLAKEEIQARRIEIAERFAGEWGQVVVLKGAYTVVAEPGGEVVVIPVATPALARAGTGDVLAGLIVGLRAQGVPAFDAAIAGAWIHAHAGLAAARALGATASVLAGDVLRAVPGIFHELTDDKN